jgi:hypothetical protein
MHKPITDRAERRRNPWRFVKPQARKSGGVTFRTEREAVKMSLRGFPLLCSWPSTRIFLANTVRSNVYGRFMGGSDRNRSNSGRLVQFVQGMQITQSRINTGYFASR